MKKILVVIFLFVNIFIFSQTEKKPSSNSDIFGKRNFFDLSLISGYSVVDKHYMGGNFGFNVGYMYAVTRYFALGPGYTFLFSIMYYDYSKITDWAEYINRGINYIISMNITLQFMIGELRDKNMAFLLDIGGGMIFTVKAGFYYKGFLIKAGYNLGGSDARYMFTMVRPTYHSATLECGYMFNWK